jgi:hypothetical protein
MGKRRNLLLFLTVSLLIFSFSIVLAGSKELRDKIVNLAVEQIGKIYLAGAQGPASFDCSGLAFYVYHENGFSMPRYRAYQFYDESEKIDNNINAFPGDLVFLKDSQGTIYHMGIYVGDGKLIAAASYELGVDEENLSYWQNLSDYAGIRRLKTSYWPNNDNGYNSERVNVESKPVEEKSWWQRIIDYISKIFKTPENINVVQNSMIPLPNSEKGNETETKAENSASGKENEKGGNLKEALLDTDDELGGNSCGNHAQGLLQYSPEKWQYSPHSWQDDNNKDENYFVKGFFSSIDGKCKINYYDGPMQGTFCESGVDEERKRKENCSEDVLTINSNKLYRYFGEEEKGGKFVSDYRFSVDDQKCCDGYGGCGYFFVFYLEAFSQASGIECMKNFEEMLKTLQIKKDVSAETKPKQTAESEKPQSDSGNKTTVEKEGQSVETNNSDTAKPQETKVVSLPKSKYQIVGKATAFVVDQHGDPVKVFKYWLEDNKGSSVCNGIIYCSGNLTNTGYLETMTVLGEGEYTLKIKSSYYNDFTQEIRIPKEGVFLGNIIVKQPSKIKGFFVDQKGDPVGRCNFWLMDDKGSTSGLWSADQEMDNFHLSSDTGYFETLSIADGIYQFMTSHCAYTAGDNQLLNFEDVKKTVTVSGDDIDLGKITLRPKGN